MALFQIKSRFTAKVLFEKDAGSLKACAEAAVVAGAEIVGADLAGANLSGVNLSGANLRDSSLVGANLRDANLSGVNLSGANLVGSYLVGVNLSGANLRDANLVGSYLVGSYLDGASLDGSYLVGANLRDSNLVGANLRDSSLVGANLSGANLRNANLSGANLSGAKGIKPEISTDLLMLLDQPGKIRAYKLVNRDGEGPINGGLKYEIGKSVAVANANTDNNAQCAVGVNVATLPWCLREWQPGYRILIVEFEAKDIAAIPNGTDGKFRLHRCDVIAEKVLDYAALGLVKKEK